MWWHWGGGAIELGFFWTGDREIPKCLCISRVQVIVNGTKKPVKLPRHLETKHRDAVGKPMEYFLSMLRDYRFRECNGRRGPSFSRKCHDREIAMISTKVTFCHHMNKTTFVIKGLMREYV
jgi:hypothetical protein